MVIVCDAGFRRTGAFFLLLIIFLRIGRLYSGVHYTACFCGVRLGGRRRSMRTKENPASLSGCGAFASVLQVVSCGTSIFDNSRFGIRRGYLNGSRSGDGQKSRSDDERKLLHSIFLCSELSGCSRLLDTSILHTLQTACKS